MLGAFGGGFNPMMMGGMNPMMMGGMGMNQYQAGFMMGMQMAMMMRMMQSMMGGMGMGGMGGMDPFMMGMGMGMNGGMGDALGGYMGMGGGGGYSPVPFGGGCPYPNYGGGGYGNCGNYGGGYGGGMPPIASGGNFGNSGSAAVELGRRFLGQNSIDCRGRLPNFRAAGGQTNNCADFVSSCLQSTGRLNGHPVGVRALEQTLLQQGYRQIPASQAKPGDVWINPSRGHTELVAAPGGTRLIGSNNDRPGHQVISEKPHNPGNGIYYSRG